MCPLIDNVDELLPVEGKDEAYDEISAEIAELEDGLEKELKKLKKQLGCDLTYWHSAQGTKVAFPAISTPVKKPPDDRYRWQEIYLVQTKAGQGGIPKNWIKSGATKVRLYRFLSFLIALLTHTLS